MDEKNRALLNEIQSNFPVDSHPYRVLGERLGMVEDEIRERVFELRRSGIIRRIGASINSRRIGFVSTLLAAKAPEDKFDRLRHTKPEFTRCHSYGRISAADTYT